MTRDASDDCGQPGYPYQIYSSSIHPYIKRFVYLLERLGLFFLGGGWVDRREAQTGLGVGIRVEWNKRGKAQSDPWKGDIVC